MKEERRKRKPLPLGSQMPIGDDTFVSRLKGLYDIEIERIIWFWEWSFLICLVLNTALHFHCQKATLNYVARYHLRAKFCLLVSKPTQ